MKILILEESYQDNDALEVLVEAFEKGARSAGHSVRILDLADFLITPCYGCLMCGFDSPCVHTDDMDELRDIILESDALVFASSPTDKGVTPQMHAALTRFIYFTLSLRKKGLHSALLSVSPKDTHDAFAALVERYESLVGHLAFRDKGKVLATVCGSVEEAEKSPYRKEAEALGKGM